ncbi:RnfABCDGE type electron transport complex subunit D [Mangrovimonas cancribranchiae]|uniref:RnfABCDGE type electron transport complex subunit D n=1 Tax=Mangrovimonas cancribranchiae TaxID=3080055 RepID=A0AAU6P535_9FLAO
MRLNPYIKPKYNSTRSVMVDVLIALLPVMFVGTLAYGSLFVSNILWATAAALLSEFLFAVIYTKHYKSVLDGSAVVTAWLLCCTLSVITPWYMIVFGAFAAVTFGKMVWGGLGKNRFNPALVGREFMVCFFPVVMTSAAIWQSSNVIVTEAEPFFPGLTDPTLNEYLSHLVYHTTGAMGEYSIVALLVGGLYLILRRRISWHIPFSLLTVFMISFWLIDGGSVYNFSFGGVLLGTLFMATDMPSSPTNPYGKLYYGAMIGLVAFIMIIGGASYEYMSYSILILNGFSYYISTVFVPRIWGRSLNYGKRLEAIFLLTLCILGTSLAILSLNYYNLIHYLVYVYMFYIILKFNYSFIKQIKNPI